MEQPSRAMRMNERERFAAVLDYRPVDRMPAYIFGWWAETLVRWQREGLAPDVSVAQAVGLDTDWEEGMWDIHGMALPWPIADEPGQVLEETAEWRLVRTGLGAVVRESKLGSSIPEQVRPALEPTRAAWQRFKRFLDPADLRHRPAGWESRADALNARTRVATFMAGSLYGWPREWLGVEGISYLMYDDPALLEEIVEHLIHWFITLYDPIVSRVSFDCAYVFEDCCGKSGPLFSPALYRQIFHKHYVRLIDFYRARGIRHILVDSDGWVDALVPCWLESGFDILFPVEVGTWGADPRAFRRQFGRGLRMMGGVDKRVSSQGGAAVRRHLEGLRGLADEGGFLPMPDHRLPPECSLDDLKTYVRVFRSVFG